MTLFPGSQYQDQADASTRAFGEVLRLIKIANLNGDIGGRPVYARNNGYYSPEDTPNDGFGGGINGIDGFGLNMGNNPGSRLSRQRPLR